MFVRDSRNYTLMHRDISVADIIISPALDGVVEVNRVFDSLRLPVGTCINGSQDIKALRRWWRRRGIPQIREGIDGTLEYLGTSNLTELQIKSFGLSLTDHYWIKPEGLSMSWEDINFFDNDFSEEIGRVMLADRLCGSSMDSDLSQNISAADYVSPDATSAGMLKKRWAIIDNRRKLIKAATPPFYQQAYNEAIASVLCEKLGIPHVKYSVMIDGQNLLPYSVCDCFTTNNIEFVPADLIRTAFPRKQGTTLHQHYIDCCYKLGIDDIAAQIDKMIILDFLLVNNDRHLGNFGLLRDSNTLKFVGAAPLFDNGTSLGYNQPDGQLDLSDLEGCKPFADSHDKQIALVSDCSCINIGNLHLDELTEDIWKILSAGDGTPREISNYRSDCIVQLLGQRLERLKLALSRQHDEGLEL